MAGTEKKVIAFLPEIEELELMYKLFHNIVGSLDDLLSAVKSM